jgi:predicted ArsR family transcriptional regulator
VKQRLIQQVGRSARLRVLNELKRTEGLCVADLAARMGMSYMGVKDVCVELAKRGLLDTWRSPVPRGRPQMLYRLTQRAHDLFPTTSNAMTIDVLTAAQQLFGAAAAEKLLLVASQKKTAQYAARIKGETLAERAKWLARLRDHDGHMAECVTGDDGALRIVEHHSPVLDLLQEFPLLARLEGEMFARLLGVPVRREEKGGGGTYSAVFEIGAETED